MYGRFFQLSCTRIAAMVGGAMMLLSQTAFSSEIPEGQRMHPVQGKEGMVVTSHFLATQSAQEVLKMGANAIDAAPCKQLQVRRLAKFRCLPYG